jgi:hypothetical protein
MEAELTSITSVGVYDIARRDIPEDSRLHCHSVLYKYQKTTRQEWRENFK